MGDLRVIEHCSCSATIDVTGSTYRSTPGGGTNGAHRSAEEVVERWRLDHHHVATTGRLVTTKNPIDSVSPVT